MADFVETIKEYNNMCSCFKNCEDGCVINQVRQIDNMDDCAALLLQEPQLILDAIAYYNDHNPYIPYPTWKEVFTAFAKMENVSLEEFLDTPIPKQVTDFFGVRLKDVPDVQAAKEKRREADIINISDLKEPRITH